MRWRTLMTGWRFFTADETSWEATNPDTLQRAWWLLLLTLGVWGALMIGLWHGASLLFASFGRPFVLPGLALTFALLLGTCRRAAPALVDISLARAGSTSRAIAASMLVVALLCLLMMLEPQWHRQDGLPELSFLRPESKMDRVLLLMGFWGLWSMLALAKFRPIHPAAGPTARLINGCGPLTVAVLMGLLLAWSITCFAFLPWIHLTIPAVAIIGGLGGGVGLSIRAGRTDRRVLLAAFLLTQLLFLAAFLANCHIRW